MFRCQSFFQLLGIHVRYCVQRSVLRSNTALYSEVSPSFKLHVCCIVIRCQTFVMTSVLRTFHTVLCSDIFREVFQETNFLTWSLFRLLLRYDCGTELVNHCIVLSLTYMGWFMLQETCTDINYPLLKKKK